MAVVSSSGSASDHREDKTQTVTQISGLRQSAIQQSFPAVTPTEELNKDDCIDIDAHISGEPDGQDPSYFRNAEQEPSSSDRQTPPQVQAKVITVHAQNAQDGAKDTHSNSPTHQTLKSKWKQELCSCDDFPMQQVIGALLVMRCTLVATWHGEKADGITRGEDLH